MPASVIVGPSKFKPNYRPASAAPPGGGGTGRGLAPAPQMVSDAASGGGYGPQTHTMGAGAPTPKQAAANAAAKSSSSLQQYLSYLGSNMGRQPSLLDQLTAPIIAGYRAQARAGDQQIMAMTKEYASQLSGIGAQSNAAYAQAEQQQNALDTAVGTALQGGDVGAAASKLSQSLALAGQSQAPAAQAAANLSSTGASEYASSSAGLTQLFQDAAATKAYNAQLPGLANLAGIQAVSAYNAGLTSAEAQAVSDAQKLLPSLMDAQTNQQRLGIEQYNAETSRARTQAQIASEQSKANKPQIYGNAQTGFFAITADGKNVQLTSPGQKAPKTFSSGGNEYTFNPNTGQTTQITHNPKAPKTPATKKFPDGSMRQYNPNTGQWQVIAGPGPGKGGKGGAALTPGEAQSYLKQISHTTTQTDKTTGAKTTVTTHTAQYGTAYRYLRSHGVDDVQARSLLDSTYKRGQDGRAWLTNEEQATLKSAAARYSQPRGGMGPPTPGSIRAREARDLLRVNLDPVSHHRFLSPIQYQVLKAAGKLPPGAFQPTPVGNRYYIAQQ